MPPKPLLFSWLPGCVPLDVHHEIIIICSDGGNHSNGMGKVIKRNCFDFFASCYISRLKSATYLNIAVISMATSNLPVVYVPTTWACRLVRLIVYLLV